MAGKDNSLVVGVLALQGAFAKHIERLVSLGVKAIEVRKSADLARCDALIIPGGESTTILRQIHFLNIEKDVIEFGAKKPVFGTCAGLILMSKEILSDPMIPFGLLDIAVERNAFGRQAESFHTTIEFCGEAKKSKTIPAFFIRAPRIRKCGTEVDILAVFQDEPILVRQGHLLGATFHPELTNDPSIHQYFLNMVAKAVSK